MLSCFKIPHANLAMAECIISKTPVIAGDTEEAREYSSDGKAAMLFEFDSIFDFESSVKKYLLNPIEAKENVMKYSEEIQEQFDSKRNARVLDSIYKKLL